MRRARGELSRRRYVVLLGIVLVLQVGLSTEVLATASVVGAITLVAGLLVAPRIHGARILTLVGDTILAGLLAAVVVAPYLYYAVVYGGAPTASPGAPLYGTDLFNPFVPTVVNWIHGAAVFEGGHWAEADGYLSVALLVGFVLWADRERGRFMTRLLVVALTACFILSLGSQLEVNGMVVVRTLPYAKLAGLPIVDGIEPSRIMLYASLIVAVAMADWLAVGRRRSRGRGPSLAWRWVIVGVGVVLLAPDVGSSQWHAAPDNPAFFTAGTYRRYLTPGESVLVLPYGQNDNSMLWQAETGFSFRMPEGYLSDFTPPPFAAVPATAALESNAALDPAALGLFLRIFRVRHIIVAGSGLYQGELNSLGVRGRSVAGVTLYDVPRPTG